MDNIGIILLAAGSSSRLGRPKQLLPYKGRSLFQHSLMVALSTSARPVVVVLGATADLIEKEVDNRAHLVLNPDWQEGMASSIRCGVNAVMEKNSALEGLILMVCDQPFVTTALLNDLVAAHRKTGKKIIACGYGDTYGPPVFFHRSLFAELLQLKGDIGARNIVRQHADAAEIIPFPEGNLDVDTEADVEKLRALTGASKESKTN